jgi:dTDP-4-dehydrorhamnose 3,5-epimerase
MGKMVRTLRGRMVDMVLDIRKGSPTHGKIIAYDMPANKEDEEAEWIYVPPGFAHGNYFSTKTMIEYMCTGEYSPGCEAGISPLSKDLDWSLCDKKLRKEFLKLTKVGIFSEKDKAGYSLEEWGKDKRSDNFIFGKL